MYVLSMLWAYMGIGRITTMNSNLAAMKCIADELFYLQ